MRDARIDVDITSKLHMEVPQCGDFFNANLGQDHSQDIKEAEG
jgi:alpha-acetolactate decarboxylase